MEDGPASNIKDYIINGKYSIEKNQMIFVAPEMRVVLEEVK